jgi:hypothetical protein
VSDEFDARAVRELSMTSGSPTLPLRRITKQHRQHLLALRRHRSFLQSCANV